MILWTSYLMLLVIIITFRPLYPSGRLWVLILVGNLQGLLIFRLFLFLSILPWDLFPTTEPVSAQSTGATEYTDRFSAEEQDSHKERWV